MPNNSSFNTFEGILEALQNAPRDRQGRLLGDLDYTFKVFISVVGELAAISANYQNTQSDRENLGKVIGAIASCVVGLTNGYGIDFRSAIESFLDNDASGAAAGARPAAGGQRVLTVNPVNDKGAADDGLLSPRTVSNFFPELDRYRSKSREDYNNELSWFVLKDNGDIVDLKPNGRNIPVLYDELQYYLTLADMYRTRAAIPEVPNPRSSNPSVVPSENTPVRAVTRTLVVNAPHYNSQQEASLFSPTHFDNGLFAPLNNQTAVQVTYTESPPAARGNNNSQNRAPSANGSPNAGVGASEVERFWATIGKIERHELSGDELNNCQLTFSAPTADGGSIDLITSGSRIRVTSNNLDSFLKLVKEKMSNPNTAKVMRTGSIRPMAVSNVPYNPIVDEGRFSPSHFTNNLFAPFTSNTAVSVDLNNQDLVPSAIRGVSITGGNNSATNAVPPAASTVGGSSSSAGGIASALKNFNANRQRAAPPAPTFADRIRNSDDEFVAILSHLDADQERVNEYGVTYCIPAACVNKNVLAANPQNHRDGVYDLIPNGRNIPVPPSSVPQYFEMIENAAKV